MADNARFAQRAAAASRMRREIGMRIKAERALIQRCKDAGWPELHASSIAVAEAKIRLLEGVLAAGREGGGKNGKA